MSLFKKKKKKSIANNPLNDLDGGFGLGDNQPNVTGDPLGQMTDEANQPPPAHLNSVDVPLGRAKKGKKAKVKKPKAKKEKKSLFSAFSKNKKKAQPAVDSVIVDNMNMGATGNQPPTLDNTLGNALGDINQLDVNANTGMNASSSSSPAPASVSAPMSDADMSTPFGDKSRLADNHSMGALKARDNLPTAENDAKASKKSTQLKVIAALLIFMIVGAVVAFLMFPLLEGLGGQVKTDGGSNKASNVTTTTNNVNNTANPTNVAPTTKQTGTNPPVDNTQAVQNNAAITTNSSNGDAKANPATNQTATTKAVDSAAVANSGANVDSTGKKPAVQAGKAVANTTEVKQVDVKPKPTQQAAQSQTTKQQEANNTPKATQEEEPDSTDSLEFAAGNKQSGEKLMGFSSNKNKEPERKITNKDFVDLADVTIYRDE